MMKFQMLLSGWALFMLFGFMMTTASDFSGSGSTHELTAEEIQPITTGLAGGWIYYKQVDKETAEVLKNAVAKNTNIKFEPVAFSCQVVAGVNYCFICVAIPTGEREIPYFCSVSFYRDLKGNYNNVVVKKINNRNEN